MPRYGKVVSMPGGGTMIVCYSGSARPSRCQYPGCTRDSAFECDYPDYAPPTPAMERIASGPKTCDRKFCLKHGRRVASETDFCWLHQDLPIPSPVG